MNSRNPDQNGPAKFSTASQTSCDALGDPWAIQSERHCKEMSQEDSANPITHSASEESILQLAGVGLPPEAFRSAAIQLLGKFQYIGISLEKLPNDDYRQAVLDVLKERNDLRGLEIEACPRIVSRVLDSLLTVQQLNSSLQYFGLKLSSQFSNEELTSADVHKLSHLIGLTSLDVSSNSIGDSGVAQLTRLTKLTTLDVSGNNIGDAGASSLGEMTSLVSLIASSNNIGDAGAGELAQLIGLTTLDVSSNNIRDAGAAALAKLTGLTSLDVSYNGIGDAGVAELAKLTALKSLDVRSNYIGDAGAAELTKLHGLRSLEVWNNSLSVHGESTLQTRLPYTNILLR